MEKRRPTYPLRSIKSCFCEVTSLNISGSALRSGFALLESEQGIVDCIQSIEPRCFYKSMTSYVDHRVWQDVYRVPHEDIELYVKFTVVSHDDRDLFIISLKKWGS